MYSPIILCGTQPIDIFNYRYTTFLSKTDSLGSVPLDLFGAGVQKSTPEQSSMTMQKVGVLV